MPLRWLRGIHARGAGKAALFAGHGDPLPVARACGAFFPTRGKEPKGARWQPKRDSTMAAPGPLAAWLGDGTSCGARLFASSRGRLGAALDVTSVVRWRPGGTGGPPSLRAGWWAFGCACWARGSFAHRRMCGGVLSHSRERTKGRPVAAKLRQHHGCPRTPPRLAWGRSLVLREANCFLAGAAWNALRCCVCSPLAAGRHRWAALAARGMVGLAVFG